VIIKNYEELVGVGGKAVEVVLKLFDEGIRRADPYSTILEKVHIEDHILSIHDVKVDLRDIERIVIVGAGKASGRMAEAMESILEDRISDGIVLVPREEARRLKHIVLWGSDHPIPSKRGVEGARRIVDTVSKLSEHDLVIVLLSGGASALMPLPYSNIDIDDLRELTEQLLKCGADIREVNAVRKHISMIKGGWLARHAFPARVISLIISDVVGDPIDVIGSGPTAPDTSTFEDAVYVLKKYSIFDKVPESIRQHLLKGCRGEIPETPKPGDELFKKVDNLIIASNRESLKAMCRLAKSMGFNTLILSSTIEGEAREVGKVLSSIAREVYRWDCPIPKPAVIVSGGETTVTVRGKGLGGRNQELVLSAAKGIDGLKNVAIGSIGSDGIDGVTDAAGGVVDGKTIRDSIELGIDIEEYLANNDSFHALQALKRLIYTGRTGTNVNDFQAIVVLRQSTLH